MNSSQFGRSLGVVGASDSDHKSAGPPTVKRAYVIASAVVLVLAAIWIWSPANLEQSSSKNLPGVIAERAATAVIVAEGRLYCHDPNADPMFSVQLGACLPGAREIGYLEYQAGTKEN